MKDALLNLQPEAQVFPELIDNSMPVSRTAEETLTQRHEGAESRRGTLAGVLPGGFASLCLRVKFRVSGGGLLIFRL